MTVWLQGERGGQVQSDVGEGALQGGHAVSGGQRPALHDAHVIGAVDALHIVDGADDTGLLRICSEIVDR